MVKQTTDNGPAMVQFHHLPNELLDQIFGHLGSCCLQICRLACSMLEPSASAWLFKTVTLSVDPTSVDWFSLIAHSERVRPHVREVRLRAQLGEVDIPPKYINKSITSACLG